MKKISLSVLVVALACTVAIVGFTAATPTPEVILPQSIEATALDYTELTNNIDVPGFVQSSDVTKIYSTVAYPVQNLAVKVGDTVKEGDLLCQLDTKSLELSIEQQSTAISEAEAKAQHSLSVAQLALETAKFNNEKDFDATMQRSESLVVSSEKAVETAEINLLGAQQADSYARRDLRDFRDANDLESTTDVESLPYELKAAYEGKRASIVAKENAVDSAEIALQNAKKALTDAKQGLKTAKIQYDESIINIQNQVKSAKLNANLSDQWLGVQKLKLDLEKSVVTAPTSGVVTVVNVAEGAPGSGLLFVIEDTSKLEAVANIDEFDIIDVSTGSNVTISPDADEDDLYTGKVTKIASTTAKTPTGENIASPKATYETKATVDSTGSSRLKAGMHVRMKIDTESKKEVFAAPYSSVSKNAKGESIVIVAKKQADGKYLAEEITVVRGLETPTMVEITSDKLTKGDLILSSVQGVHAGDTVIPVVKPIV